MLPALGVLLTVAAGCSDDKQSENRRQLSEYAQSVSARCPVSLDIMGVVDTVTYNPDSASFVYHVKVNEQLFPARQFASFSTDLLEGALRNAAVDDSVSAAMMGLMAQSGTSLKVLYVGSTSGVSRVDSITPDRLSTIAARKALSRSDWARIFNSSLKLQQATLPADLGDGMVQTGLDLADSTIVYTIELPDELRAMATPKRAPLIRQAMFQMLKSTNASRNFALLVHNAGYGLEYRFVDRASKPLLEISIPMNELDVAAQ